MNSPKPGWKERARGFIVLAAIALLGYVLIRGLVFIADMIVGEEPFPRFLAPVEASMRGETDRQRASAAFTRDRPSYMRTRRATRRSLGSVRA